MARIDGTPLGDYLVGTDEDDQIFGAEGSDTLDGGLGNDVLDSGPGSLVTFHESLGDDTMVVQPGNWTFKIRFGDSGGSDTLVLPGMYPLSGLSFGTDGLWMTFSFTRDLSKVSAMPMSVVNITFTGNEDANAWGQDTSDNVMIGNAGVNILEALGGNDTLSGGGGNDTLDGGPGRDEVRYPGPAGDYTITRAVGERTVLDNVGLEGLDNLIDIERIRFADRSVAFDIDGPAGDTVRLIGAIFGKQYLFPEYIGIGIDLFDRGQSMAEIAEFALSTWLFNELAGSRSNADFVTTVYRNVIGHDPSDPEHGYFEGILDRGEMTQAQLAAYAADSVENADHLELIGYVDIGIAYVQLLS